MLISTPSIHILVRQVYGNTTFYPMCESAELFAHIAGSKTLTRKTLAYIKQLGYEIVQHHEDTEL
jgi:hypothetical protein